MRPDLIIFTLGFWLLLLIPAPLVLTGLGGDTSLEARQPTAYPELERETLLEAETYGRISAALEDRMPWRTDLVGFRSRLARRGLIPNPFEKVVFGRGDWLYVAESFDPHCPEPERSAVIQRLAAVAGLLKDHGIDFRVTLIPNKASIHEDGIPAWIRDEHAVARSATADLRDRMTRQPGWFIDLEPALRSRLRRDPDRPLYHPTDTHWTWAGGEIFVAGLVGALVPDLYDPVEVVQVAEVPVTFDLDRLSGSSAERMLPYYAAARPGTEPVVSRGAADEIITTKSGEPGRLVPGTTLIIRDSFWDFIAPVAQDYFEHLHSIHAGNAAGRTDLADLLAGVDRVVLALGERKFCEVALETIASEGFTERLRTALRNRSQRIGVD